MPTPYLAFRFKEKSHIVTRKINDAVASYVGLVSWSMIKKKRSVIGGENLIIEPTFMELIFADALNKGITIDNYLEKFKPEPITMAYHDFNLLISHIRVAIG